MKVVAAGRSYKIPFPRDILRKKLLDIKPTKLVALGILEVTVISRMPGREPTVKVRLDDSVEARREIITNEVKMMMDPNAEQDDKSAALAWTRALDEALSEVLTEAQRKPAFRAAP